MAPPGEAPLHPNNDFTPEGTATASSMLTRRRVLAAGGVAGLGLLLNRGRGLAALERQGVEMGRPPFRPPRGSVLLIAGQNPWEILPYLDSVDAPPSGITLYTGLSRPVGYTETLDRAPDAVLHLSINWIRDFPLEQSQLDQQQALLDGANDAGIDALADWCKEQARPILARLGYEFDRIPPYYYDKRTFAESFRYIVDRFRARGADNIAWVWASSNYLDTDDRLSDANFDAWYPGDDYVDWFGYSMWYPNVDDDVMMRRARCHDKPVLLAETTPSTYNIRTLQVFPGGTGPPTDLTAEHLWDAWFAPMVSFIDANADVIAGWHYISTDWSQYEGFSDLPLFSNADSRLWLNPDILQRWDQMAASPPFLSASPELFATLGAQPLPPGSPEPPRCDPEPPPPVTSTAPDAAPTPPSTGGAGVAAQPAAAVAGSPSYTG